MPGLIFSNTMIFRDETLHYKFAIYLLSYVRYMITDTRIIEIVSSGVKCEKEFVNEALSTDLIGMNSIMLCQYIEFVGDQMFSLLDIPKLYDVSNPFLWMDTILADTKINFFEKRNPNYQKGSFGEVEEKRIFNPNVDF